MADEEQTVSTGRTVFSVRPADPSDAEAVAALLHQLGYSVAVDRVAQRLGGFSDSQSDHVLLGIENQQILGLIAVSVTPLLVEGAFARITALIVDERRRAKGLGGALVAEAERLAQAAGCAVIQVSSGKRAERTQAHRFYRHLGYIDAASHHILYERRLKQPAL